MYALISTPGVEPLPANYDDQRFIQSYGPVESFAPGESFNIIIAVAIGEGLAGLQASADWAQKLYDDDYIAPAPPPSPLVNAYPADGQVTLVWESEGRWVDKGVDKSPSKNILTQPIQRKFLKGIASTGVMFRMTNPLAILSKIGRC